MGEEEPIVDTTDASFSGIAPCGHFIVSWDDHVPHDLSGCETQCAHGRGTLGRRNAPSCPGTA